MIIILKPVLFRSSSRHDNENSDIEDDGTGPDDIVDDQCHGHRWTKILYFEMKIINL